MELKLNKNYYSLPESDLYEKKFDDIIINGYINLDCLTDYMKYSYLRELLSFVCNIIFESNSLDENELQIIKKKVKHINDLQRISHNNGRIKVAINQITNLLLEILSTYNQNISISKTI